MVDFHVVFSLFIYLRNHYKARRQKTGIFLNRSMRKENIEYCVNSIQRTKIKYGNDRTRTFKLSTHRTSTTIKVSSTLIAQHHILFFPPFPRRYCDCDVEKDGKINNFLRVLL